MLKLYRWLPSFKGKSRLGKLLFKNLLNKDKPLQFTAHKNIRYKIPNTFESLGVELLLHGIYEKAVVNFFITCIKPGDIFFDIGANIGAIGLPVIKFKSNIQYFGFEASPVVFDFLKYNFIQNNIMHCELHNYVVHEHDNLPVKFYDSEQYGKSSLAPTYSGVAVSVNSISLDQFCDVRHLSNINWIKVDVQGFELFVFKGMKNLLCNKKVENIVFEFEFWAEEAAGFERGAAQKYLLETGYELFDLGGKKLPAILTTGRAMIWAKLSAEQVTLL